MIIRSIHFRCCAMRIRAIPSPFQRKTALRVSVAIYALPYFALPLLRVTVPSNAFASRHQPRIALAFLCAAPCQSIALRFISMPLPNNASPLFAISELFYSLLLRCCACLGPSMPLLFQAHRGDSFRCPAIACHCFSILRLRYAKHLQATPFQRYANLRFSFALPRYASPRKSFAAFHVPKQNSAGPMQFLTVRRSTSPLLCLAPLHLALHHFAYPLLC